MSLRDYSQIKEENIRLAKVPLKIELIKEYFENKELFFIIDYPTSDIKGNMFLTYLSNLDLPCEVDLTKASIVEKFELVKIYMQSRHISESDVLKLSVAELLLTYKKVATDKLFQNSIFSSEEKQQFINDNLEIFKKWDQFVSSSMIFLMKAFPELNEVLKVETQFTEVSDPTFIGLNVVNLFDIPAFTEFFYSAAPTEQLVYFKPQFEEYMFKGKNFFHYFNTPSNTLVYFMAGMLNGQISTENVISYLQA